MRFDPEKRCVAFEKGRQCQRKKKKRDMCLIHYDRAQRKGGEVRTERELRAIREKARLAKMRAMRAAIMGEDTDAEPDGRP